MRRQTLISLMLISLIACGRGPAPVEERAAFWDCDGFEFAAYERNGGVRLHVPGEEVVLVPVPDHEGRFENARYKLRYVDDGAVLDVDGARWSCVPKEWAGPWAAARERGAAFRGIGQEPGWHVEVIPDGPLTLVLDYGGRTLSAPTPAVSELAGGARGYQAEDEHGRLLLVLIEPLICFDTMSGEVFPDTVTVAVGDDRYRGCGLAP